MSAGVTFSMDEALHLARQMQHANLAADAEKVYLRILETEPDHLDTLHFYGVLCHRQGRIDDAERHIGRILELAPENADAYNNLGNVLQSGNRLEEAEEHYRKAIGIDPSHPSAHSNLGVLLAASGRSDEAVTCYRRAAELDPRSADIRCNLGNALRREGILDQAVCAYQEAIAADPWHDESWRGLAHTLRSAGRHDLAATVFDDWLRFRPGDPSIQYLRQACLGEATPARAPEAFVQNLFDKFADKFDAHLGSLEYRAPELIGSALAAVLPAPAKALDVLDAGCGTGLCGPLLAPYAKSLTGIDLSGGMLTQADKRGNYDALVLAELTDFMERRPDAFDVVVSCDTLCYFGELGPVFAAVCGTLRPGGRFAFTLEAFEDDGEGYRLNPTGRYAHQRPYVVQALSVAGLAVVSYSCEVLRSEGRVPVSGHVIVAAKP